MCDADIISKMCTGGAVFNGSVSVTQPLYTGGKVTTAYRMAQLSEQMSRKQYEAGMESIGDLLEAQTLWQQAYATMVENRCAKYLAHVKYLKAAVFSLFRTNTSTNSHNTHKKQFENFNNKNAHFEL